MHDFPKLGPDRRRDLDVARAAALRAGALIRERWDTTLQIAYKGEVDLVSEVDLGAEQIILEDLKTAFPDDAVVAEEGGAHTGKSGRTWYVDPLDGTTNFSHGLPHFAVSIALFDGRELTTGIIYEPLTPRLFAASNGAGAWLGDRRLSVSATETLDRALLATGFPYDRRTRLLNNTDRFAHLLRKAQALRRAGAACLDLAFVAAGWLDGYWEQTLNSWDLAAGALLVTEAGGQLSDFRGGPGDFLAGEIVATNGRFHADLLAALHEARPTEHP